MHGKDMERLLSCHMDLQTVVLELARSYEIRVICGHRNKLEQDIAYGKGNSKLKWPNSRHNSVPSEAVDIIPMRNGNIDWQDIGFIKEFAEDVKRVAKDKNISLTWGGEWRSLKDYVHWELV